MSNTQLQYVQIFRIEKKINYIMVLIIFKAPNVMIIKLNNTTFLKSKAEKTKLLIPTS